VRDQRFWGLRIVGILIVLMPLLLVLFMAVITPSYFAPLFRSGIGVVVFSSMVVTGPRKRIHSQ
jgi:Flp pilus assembly protein TadB